MVIDEMMYHSIAEIRRKYLSLDRLINYEAYTWAYRIAVFENFVGKLEDIVLKVFLERQGVDSITLVPPGIKICLEKLCNNSLAFICIHGLFGC